jgi:hypothetical protein
MVRIEVHPIPFPEAGGIAVKAQAKKDPRVCVLKLPATVLQRVKRQSADVA